MVNVKGLYVTLFVVSAVALGFGTFFGELTMNYVGEDASATITEDFTVQDETQADIDKLEKSIRTPELSLESFVDVLATGVLTTLRLTFGAVNIYSTLFTQTIILLGLPSWVFAIVMGIIVVVVLFSIMKGITKTEV